MYNLFVGDVDEYLSVIAKQHDASAQLITEQNLHTLDLTKPGYYYTSLADVGHEALLNLCLSAGTLHYYPPEIWSDSNHGNQQKVYTEYIVCFASQTVPTVNAELAYSDYKFFQNKFQANTRHSDSPQCWISGCSVTYGIGVHPEQTWKHLVSSQLGLPMVDLSKPSASILWSADQICLADVRKDDCVFWGLTSHGRLPIVYEHNQDKWKLVHLIANTDLSLFPNLPTEMLVDLLDSNTLNYLNIMAVRRVYNFCQKAQAKLVILGLLPDYKNIYKFFDVPVFRQHSVVPHKFLDIGFDREGHPGPLSHQDYANTFLKLYREFYQ